MYSLWKISSVEAANLFGKLSRFAGVRARRRNPEQSEGSQRAALRASEPAGETPNKVRDLRIRSRTRRRMRETQAYPALTCRVTNSLAVLNGMLQTLVDDV